MPLVFYVPIQETCKMVTLLVGFVGSAMVALPSTAMPTLCAHATAVLAGTDMEFPTRERKIYSSIQPAMTCEACWLMSPPWGGRRYWSWQPIFAAPYAFLAYCSEYLLLPPYEECFWIMTPQSSGLVHRPDRITDYTYLLRQQHPPGMLSTPCHLFKPELNQTLPN